MSVIAINVTQIGVAQTDDLLAPNYRLDWTLRDYDDSKVPTVSGSVRGGTGCSSSGTPCPDASFDLALPANHWPILEMTLWDDQPWPWGTSPVRLVYTTNSWSLLLPSSRAAPRTQVVYSQTGTTCNPNCKVGTVSIDVTVHGLFQYQTNNRYFWYKSWGTLIGYLNDPSVSDYCQDRFKFTPQQQKAMLAAFIFSAFLLPFAAYGTTLESELVRTLVDFINHGELMAWEHYVDSLGTYAADSFQVAQLRQLFSADASSCGVWAAWQYGVGGGTTLRSDMADLDTNLVSVNTAMWANNVPQIISALNTVAAKIGTTRQHVQNMMATMNYTCPPQSICGPGATRTENSVLMPLLTYLTADALYTSGLITSLTAGGSGMRINGQLASYYATYGYWLPSVYVNTAYNAGMTVTDGMPPQAYSWSIVSGSGSPPSGMGFGAAGCAAWNFCGKATVPGTYTFRATLTDGAGDVVTIPFTIVVNVHTYTLTISTATSGGTTSPSPGSYTYPEGTQVTVTALPNSGVPFRKWRLDGVDQTPNPITVTMNGPHTLAAYFGYALTITASGPGTTSPAVGTYWYPGATVQVTATPSSGQTFRQWTLDGTAQSANPITVTMSKDHALNAYFGKKLTISVSGSGYTNPGAGTYYYANNAQVTVSEGAIPPYYFKWWTVDGVKNTNDPVTVTMNADHAVAAVFEKLPGGCVAEGTMVTLPDGSARAVEKLKIGDQVLGYDPENGAFVVETIQAISATKVGELLNFNDGALRTTTTDQPIYVRTPTGTMWIHDPIDIQVGWELFSPMTQQWTKVTSITHEYGKFKVYDFRTDGPRTYLANSLLVLDKPIPI